jgi:hypothetical protein
MNQPKYITYKGAKYERISTVNEIVVEPGVRIKEVFSISLLPLFGDSNERIYDAYIILSDGTAVWEHLITLKERYPKELEGVNPSPPYTEDIHRELLAVLKQRLEKKPWRKKPVDEIVVEPTPRIKKIEVHSTYQDPAIYDPTFLGTVGVGYYVTLSNSRVVQISADSLESRYPKELTTREIEPGIRDWRANINQLNTLLRNRIWNDTMELDEIIVQPRLRISDITLSSDQTPWDVDVFTALGYNLQVKLNNGTTVEATEDELLDRYWETVPAIQQRKTPEELAALLKNKVWDEEY